MPDCLRFTCMLVCISFCADRTRDRGCKPAPGIPCALCSQEGQEMSKARAKSVARTRTHISTVVPDKRSAIGDPYRGIYHGAEWLTPFSGNDGRW